MSTAYQFLKESGVFFIATADGNKGRVRPFGFIMQRNNTIYFCTNKSKDVYKQMVQNPDVEISAMGPKGTSWIRLRGKAVFDESRDAKAQVFTDAPDLLRIYPKGADDEVFVTFYLADAAATVFSFAGAPKAVDLL